MTLVIYVIYLFYIYIYICIDVLLSDYVYEAAAMKLPLFLLHSSAVKIETSIHRPWKGDQRD